MKKLTPDYWVCTNCGNKIKDSDMNVENEPSCECGNKARNFEPNFENVNKEVKDG